MERASEPVPLMRVMVANAMILSAGYALLGLLAELAQQYLPSRAADHAVLVIDSLPARALELLGLMAPLRDALLDHKVSNFVVRIVFGLTSFAVIFALAIVVGGVTGVLRKLHARKTRGAGAEE